MTRTHLYPIAYLVLLATLACSSSGGPPPAKSVLETALSQPNAVVLDVRTPDEYKGGHVPGAVNIPVDDIDKVPGVIADKNSTIIVHCAAGVRSAKAAKALAKMGYPNVVDAKTPEAVAKAKGVALEK